MEMKEENEQVYQEIIEFNNNNNNSNDKDNKEKAITSGDIILFNYYTENFVAMQDDKSTHFYNTRLKIWFSLPGKF